MDAAVTAAEISIENVKQYTVCWQNSTSTKLSESWDDMMFI